MSELHDKARALVALRTEMPGYWERDPHEVSAQMADTIAELLAENEGLTARLRELASAEPVAWIGQHPDSPDEQSAYLGSSPDEPGHIPLIRRPEMEL